MSTTADQQKVINTLVAAVGDKYKCKSGVIAQLIQEIGWTLKTPKDYKTGKESYNLGNIKGEGPAGHVTIITTEDYNAADVTAAKKSGVLLSQISLGGGKFKCQVYAKFRAYHSYAEAVDDHFKLLSTMPGVLSATTPEAYCDALVKAHYATDVNYKHNILSIVDSHDLRSLDKPQPKPAAKPTPKPQPAKPEYYIIQPGDALERIAKAHNTTVAAIDKLNASITNVNSIKAGQKIRVK